MIIFEFLLIDKIDFHGNLFKRFLFLLVKIPCLALSSCQITKARASHALSGKG